MSTLCELTPEQANSAASIQAHIDDLGARGGGQLVLPAMDLALDRGLQLRSGVELAGQGETTVLRKGLGRVYPLTGYHNYGMGDVPVQSTADLAVGMTVSVLDDKRRGFYSTLARITWIDGSWVGLDRGIYADYLADDHPCLTTVYPLIFGLGVRGAGVRDLHLEGNREDQEAAMDACRGSALYFAQSADIEIRGVTERGYLGEGLGYQMCRDVRVRDCRFNGNSGNGFHPGAGSTNTLFEGCVAEDNEHSGFFFCVRANHITVRDCRFSHNVNGMSIGTRDCWNLIEDCEFVENRDAGILVRDCQRPVEVHSIHVRNCGLRDNGTEKNAQIVVQGDAHDLIVERCVLKGAQGFRVFGEATDIAVVETDTSGCQAGASVPTEASAADVPSFECGYGTAGAEHFRHLDVYFAPSSAG